MAADTFYTVELVDRITRTALRATSALKLLDRIGGKLEGRFNRFNRVQKTLAQNLNKTTRQTTRGTSQIHRMSSAYDKLTKSARGAGLATSSVRANGLDGRGGGRGRGGGGARRGGRERGGFRDNIRFANSISAAGRNTLNAVRGGVDFFRDPVRRARSFELEQARVTTIATDKSFGGENQGSVRALTLRTAKDLGIDPAESSRAFFDIVSANNNDLLKATEKFEASAKLSIAGAQSISAASGLITTATNVFGVSGERVNDALFRTLEVGKIAGGLGTLSTAFGKIATQSATLGLNLEQTLAPLATITQAGVNIATASTQVRALLSTFLKPQSTAVKFANKGLGIDFGPDMIKDLGLRESLRSIIAKIREKGFDPVKALPLLFPNIRALQGFLNLSGKEFDFKLFDSRTQGLITGQGSSTRALDKIRATKGFALARQEQVFNTLKIELGTKILPLMISLGKVLEPIVLSFTRFLKTHERFVKAWGGTIITLGTATAAVGILLVGLGALGTGAAVLAGALKGLAAFILGKGLIPPVVTAVAAAAGAALPGATTVAAGATTAAGAAALAPIIIPLATVVAGAALGAGAGELAGHLAKTGALERVSQLRPGDFFEPFLGRAPEVKQEALLGHDDTRVFDFLATGADAVDLEDLEIIGDTRSRHEKLVAAAALGGSAAPNASERANITNNMNVEITVEAGGDEEDSKKKPLDAMEAFFKNDIAEWMDKQAQTQGAP